MDTHGHEARTHHVVPVSLYVAIFLSLLVFTGMTVAIAFVDLGRMNLIVALGIAIVKATLVILYFMHLRYSEKLNMVFLVAAFAWLAMLICFTISDPLTRGWLVLPQRF